MASHVCLRLSVAFCALSTLPALGSDDSLRSQSQSDDVQRPLVSQMVAQALGSIPFWNGSPAHQVTLPIAQAEPAPPTTLVYLRVSGEYLSKRFARTVSRTKPVTSLILGTRNVGESHTNGKTRLVLVPSDNEFLAELEFVGTVHSRTRGVNGPAILHYKSDSTFRATKRITLGAAGFSTAPARAEATTRLQPLSIESRSPGLMGLLVERVARRRVAQTRTQADAIASRHTADIVAADLNRGLEKAIGALAVSFTQAAGLKDGDITALTAHRAGQPMRMHLRTTPNYVEMVMGPFEATWEELSADLPDVTGNPLVALRVHRSIATHVATGSDSTPPIARLLLTGLQSMLADTTASPTPTPENAPATTSKWSIDSDWLAVDVNHGEKVLGPLRDSGPSAPNLAGAAAIGQ